MSNTQNMAGCPLSCVVVNVNGLRKRDKRRSLFQRLRQLRCCIILLCETHSRDDEETTAWTQEGAGPGLPWEGQAFWHHGTSSSRGVAILFSAGLATSAPKVTYQDAEARLLLVSFTSNEGQHPWEVLAVYGPTEPAARAQFFQGPFSQACGHMAPGSAKIVAGDWNCVTSQADFCTPNPQAAQNSRMVGGAELAQVQAVHGLVDVWRLLHPHGVDFTRVTNSGHMATYGRTTRWLISQELLDESWGASCTHLPAGQLPGDHAAVLLHLEPPNSPLTQKPSWVLPTYLLAQPEYVEEMKGLLEELCAHPPGGLSPPEFWDDLKGRVRAHTREYCAVQHYARSQDRRLLLSHVWHSKQRYLQQPGSVQLAQRFHQAVSALQAYDEQQVSARARTLDALWESYGEQGTMWFHRLGRTPADKQPIRSIRDPSGQPPAMLDSQAGVAQAGELLASFYDGSLPSGLFHPAPVSTADQDLLLQAIDTTLSGTAQAQCLGPTPDGRLTEACLKAALASAPKGKRPGCDGLPYEFYHLFWAQLAAPMVAAFNHSFLSGDATPELTESNRTGLIVLVYKGGGKPRDDPDSYRPITLLNCDVKLAAKVMAMRLGQPLDTVIDPNQTAFVPGRWIGDNVLFHLEELDYVAYTHTSACVVGIDYNKAYDRVHRGWLQRCMEALAVPAPAQRWINLLLQGSRAQIIYNGFLSRAFPVLAGCAQGSPLSPLLYVMAAQPLAAKCRQLQSAGLIDAIPLPDGSLAPPLHQHADDTTIHTQTVAGAKKVLDLAVTPFCQASGAQVSLPKSWGLTLGSHPALAGPHADTGITFHSPLQPIRHLGVPLTSGNQAAAVSELYGKKLQAIYARLRHWRRLPLSYLGRLHVAKQVLASTISYHATFLAPPEPQLIHISRVIAAYTINGSLLDEADTRPLRHRPSRLVASLPRDMGGVAQVDLEAFNHALRAKVPALLVHPKRRPWKALMAAAFERACPGVGVGLLVQQTQCYGTAAARALSPRHASYVQSLRQLGIHRGLAHPRMSREQIGLEGLVGNHSVANAQGLAHTSPTQLPPPLQGCSRLGQVAFAQWAFLKLPVSWPSTYNSPSSCRWQVDAPQHWVRQAMPTGGLQHYHVLPDGLLQLSPHAPTGPSPTWVAACVVACPDPKDPTHELQYLAGPWVDMRVDASVWTLGPTPLLGYTVRESTARLIEWQCRAAPGWVPGQGVRPKLWGTGVGPAVVGAVGDMAVRQKRRFAEAMEQPGGSGARAPPLREEDLAPLYQPSWFFPSPPRLHVRQRVAERDAQVTQQRAAQEARVAAILYPEGDDTGDPLAQAELDRSSGAPVWRSAWLRAHHKRLPRESRAFAWSLLHAALPCGGARLQFLPRANPALAECLCRAPCCQSLSPRPVETLEHLFLECAVGQRALQWLCGLWQLIDPGPAPLFVASVLLADDASAWAPSRSPSGLHDLWTVLRVTLLKRVWLARQACVHGDASASFTASRVVGSFIAEVGSLLLQDWLRVQGDIRQQGGVCPSWFRGRSTSLSLEEFQKRWCPRSVLAVASVDAHGQPRLQVKLTSAALVLGVQLV
jgi:exonuclease III